MKWMFALAFILVGAAIAQALPSPKVVEGMLNLSPGALFETTLDGKLIKIQFLGVKRSGHLYTATFHVE